MLIDGATIEVTKRSGATAELVVQRHPFAFSIKLSLEELQQLVGELNQEVAAWQEASEKNFYHILGVDRTASADEIKKAYRKLARRYHTDGQVGDEEKLKVINNAYETLGNLAQRRQYDSTLSTL